MLPGKKLPTLKAEFRWTRKNLKEPETGLKFKLGFIVFSLTSTYTCLFVCLFFTGKKSTDGESSFNFKRKLTDHWKIQQDPVTYLNGRNEDIGKHHKREAQHIDQRQSNKCFAGVKYVSSKDVDSKPCDSDLTKNGQETCPQILREMEKEDSLSLSVYLVLNCTWFCRQSKDLQRDLSTAYRDQNK